MYSFKLRMYQNPPGIATQTP